MEFSKLWVLIITAIFSTRDIVKCHPQCLDFKPPFQSNSLEFCSQYRDFGCCTKQQENAIFQRYEYVKTQLSDTLLQTCEPYLRELLCQPCSPYAAHIYSAEQTMHASSFPGLCSNYCSQFYAKCKDLVKYITSDQEILGTLNSKESFCLVVQLMDTDYCYPDLLKNEHLNFNISIQQITKEGCMCVEQFAWDLRSPVVARHAGDGSGRLFVAEQRGVIYIYYRNKTREQKAFLDIKDRVLYSSYRSDERGFLGLAFHPNFAVNRKFYTYYSAKLGRRKECIRISEFKASRKNRNRASRKTERILLQVEQPFSNHNGGELLFGDDNYLYIFIGDGGGSGDPYGNSQNMSVLLGKVLRINVNKRRKGKQYAIPLSNPFVNENETRPEIYAYGIRNIWRCDKDEGDRVTGMYKGRIICGDVGQNAYEEIDILIKGGNYGWNGREGYQCFNPAVCGMVGPEELPIFSYPHSVGKSVTGGHVYRGCENPNFNGFYIYGDFTNGRLFYLYQFNESQIWLNKEIHMCGDDVCFNGLQGSYSPFILSFGEDQYGEIYILSTNIASATVPSGSIYKLVDPFRRGNPELCEPQLSYNKTDVPYNISGILQM
ncbi:1 isoform X1 [Octopus vulgaris]|uniref:1 isoform X1 n=1 Tax=Octopus vulgaris TaxID=6645 RepID=A0AA36B7Q3_OCTVU|nr:1 isoform X1 [Octopus vulgaris]